MSEQVFLSLKQQNAVSLEQQKMAGLKKNFLCTKWNSVTEILSRKAHLLAYLMIIKKIVRKHFFDAPIFLREQGGMLVIAVKANGLSFESRCRKTAALLQQLGYRIPEKITTDVWVSVI